MSVELVSILYTVAKSRHTPAEFCERTTEPGKYVDVFFALENESGMNRARVIGYARP